MTPDLVGSKDSYAFAQQKNYIIKTIQCQALFFAPTEINFAPASYTGKPFLILTPNKKQTIFAEIILANLSLLFIRN